MGSEQPWYLQSLGGTREGHAPPPHLPEAAPLEQASKELALQPVEVPMTWLPPGAWGRERERSVPLWAPDLGTSPGVRSRGWKDLPVSLAAETADTPGPAEQESPGAPGGERSPPTGSPGRRKSHRKQPRGTSGAGETLVLLRAGRGRGGVGVEGSWGILSHPSLLTAPQRRRRPSPCPAPAGNLRCPDALSSPGCHPQGCADPADLAGPEGTSPGNSPLQGLINCLKEILVPGPQKSEAAPHLPPGPGLGLAPLTGVGTGPGSPPGGGESQDESQAEVAKAPKPHWLSLDTSPKWGVFPKGRPQLGCPCTLGVRFRGLGSWGRKLRRRRARALLYS